MKLFSDEYYMNEALKEAKKAMEEDEIPIGAVIVCNNQIIAKAHNQMEKLNDVTAHAEMLAITSASENLGNKYLSECVLYVTIEPCPMCASALGWSQIGKIIYGADDEKKGFSVFSKKLFHPKAKLQKGVLQKECAELIQNFFRAKRSKDNTHLN